MSTLWAPPITAKQARAAMELIDEMRLAAWREDEDQPHVLLIVDPVCEPHSGPVIGPYPNRADAEVAAVVKRADLNRGNTDTPFEVYVVRFFETGK